MRKIIVFNMVTVDGYFAGTDGNIDWHKTDHEFNEFAISQLKEEVGTIVFGRVTYDLMASYWQTGAAEKDDPIVAGLMNSADKIVFSKTMEKAEWGNTKLMKDIGKLDMGKLKEEREKDIFIFGSGQIVNEFAKLGLVDEYRLMVNPVTLGSGKPLFKDRIDFKLLKIREFKNGNVLLYYKPI